MNELVTEAEVSQQREKIRALINNGIFPKKFLVDPIKKVPVKEVTEQMLNKVVAIVEFGKTLNLTPYQSVNSIMDCNGKMSIYGDAMLSIVLSSGLLADKKEYFDEQNMVAHCYFKRKGFESGEERTFSQKDAEQAGLWGKGVWQQYPKRMLQMRARGFALRDVFPDVLGGAISFEEAQDYPFEDPFEKSVLNKNSVSNSVLNSVLNQKSDSDSVLDEKSVSDLKSILNSVTTVDDLVKVFKENAKNLKGELKQFFVKECSRRKQEILEMNEKTIDIE